ncbi:MAG: phenylalanine--tRNA ligase subunit beta [Chloroflexi bacterium RBG_16_56_11]|nr:MAG: phenylalanine--tRNA ligase subunit beta [Chloroflexi bacterium RBG_16_56_11]
MKVPLSWLKDYVDVTLPAAELARRITLAGFEVAEIITTGGSWENIIVGRITAVNPHPNADRLRLATVDLGQRQETVVCGAPNLNVGDKIAFAHSGAQLVNPYNGQMEELKPAKIRGVVSRGMICSEKELGISESHEGILVLKPEVEIGRPLVEYLGDSVLDIDVTANRPDCLSVVGIAHETAALCGRKMHIPEIACEESGEPLEGRITIEISAPDLCPRYCASLITGVTITDSPAWLQERLVACGQRPINNIVDITNYVMLEYGQPLHSFDYDRLKGHKIMVRRAAGGEKFYTLDEVERELTGDMLVIGDGERTVAIAGVMGGLNSEVTGSTTNILLEAASFKATSIHYTSRRLGLTSEASTRFERGISAGLTIPALRHATQLIAELGGGKIARGIIDVYPGKKDPALIPLTAAKVRRVLGVGFSQEQIVDTLESLGFDCRGDGAGIKVTAPYWRSDINQDVDIIEEVARINGYDKIPMTLLAEPVPPQRTEPIIGLKRKIRRGLAGHGFQEIMSYTLTGLDMLSNLAAPARPPEPLPARVVNPMTADQEYLRCSLRAGLLTTLANNRRYEEGGIRLFELGRIYLPTGESLPAEPEVLCGIMSGPRAERSWLGGDGTFDFHDAKGAIESLLGQLDVNVTFEKSLDAGLHPARQAAVVVQGGERRETIGIIGEVHPAVAAAFEVTGTVGLFEINLMALLPFAAGEKTYRAVPRFPGSYRDIALVVDAGVTHRQILDIISSYPLITGAELFDVYSGKPVAPGKKSLAYRLVYQSTTHTLTDAEVNNVQEQLLERMARELGAILRS